MKVFISYNEGYEAYEAYEIERMLGIYCSMSDPREDGDELSLRTIRIIEEALLVICLYDATSENSKRQYDEISYAKNFGKKIITVSIEPIPKESKFYEYYNYNWWFHDINELTPNIIPAIINAMEAETKESICQLQRHYEFENESLRAQSESMRNQINLFKQNQGKDILIEEKDAEIRSLKGKIRIQEIEIEVLRELEEGRERKDRKKEEGRKREESFYEPRIQNGIRPMAYSSFLSRIFGKKLQAVFSSVFAPAEIAPKQHLMVQVYLHLPEETEKVKSLASEADKNAERRGYEPLEVPLKKGDNVEIELNVNGDSLLYNCCKSVVWQGSFVKRAFDFIVPSDINTTELSCSVNIFVNGAIAGELIFLTAIVDSPRQLNTNVCARPTKKLFISYSHKDIASAEKIAKIHEALGIDVFFDKHRLKAGYIYSEEISKFIQTADTFVLCWSENAAKSDYVEKERQEALALAYPQSKPREQARLRIHPYNIEPHAVPPADMIEHYHFEEL